MDLDLSPTLIIFSWYLGSNSPVEEMDGGEDFTKTFNFKDVPPTNDLSTVFEGGSSDEPSSSVMGIHSSTATPFCKIEGVTQLEHKGKEAYFSILEKISAPNLPPASI
ncbi:hypothetical protein MUK42_05349 [Musa troglodytarum]|uniref:Uncharacterized protein n=1 Tax=Musa troglodytarum TaxID=320322 RepID=A0A9E7G867_9LILI|nr:hypothetical protein MUK42_05349 [Musa troglodytarum]